MTILCFVRHGQTDQNKLKKIQGQKDFPLNENGINEANALGEKLKKNHETFDYIFTSPLKRAYKTACILKDYLNLDDPIIDEAFIERSFGICEGMDVCDEVFVNILNNTAEGLEKSFDLQKRVIDECLHLSNLYPDKKLLIVSHSHTIKAITTFIDPNKYKFSDKLSNCGLLYFFCDGKKIKILD